MGGGGYSYSSRSTRARSSGWDTKSTNEIFREKAINNAMNPNGVDIRESRDSDEHPTSLAIILALDVTGSMGSIPHFLIKEGLPNIMQGIIDNGCLHPQLLFLGIGDHECDAAPLQVGQFESSDPLLDHWLTTVFLEAGGGGNAGESYHLAWYFAAHHTSIDCFEKRNQKGLLFTIGDEPVLSNLPQRAIKSIMGNTPETGYSAIELLDKARETYEVYHFHLLQGSNGRNPRVQDGWKQLMGDHLLMIERKENVVSEMIRIVSNHNESSNFISQGETFIDDVPHVVDDVPHVIDTTPNDEDMML